MALANTNDGPTAASARWSFLTKLGPVEIFSLLFLFLIVVLAIILPILPLDPTAQNLTGRRLSAPFVGMNGDFRYVFGGDELGRSVLARLIDGARVSLAVGVFASSLAMLIGVPLGIMAAVFRGWVEDVIMRATDLWMSLPTLLLSLVALYAVGPGMINLILTLAILRWMVFARVARAITLSITERQFYEAARAIGTGPFRIIRLHVLPNLYSIIFTLVMLEAARAMLTEASLSFLGLGIQPPQTSWGTMLAGARVYMRNAPWLILFPGIAIVLTVLSMNLLVRAARGRSGQIGSWDISK